MTDRERINKAQSKTLFLRVVFCALFALALLGCVNISGYEGDGSLEVLQRFPVTALNITFDTFSSREPFHKDYSIRGLPTLSYEYLIGLGVTEGYGAAEPWPPSQLTKLRGSISFKVIDKDGVLIHEFKGGMNECFWTIIGSDEMFGYCGAARDDKSGRFIPGERWPEPLDRLVVDYDPEADNAPMSFQTMIVSDLRQ